MNGTIDDIDIRGLDKAAVLAALYNAAPVSSLGLIMAGEPRSMSVEEAREMLSRGVTFDYVCGRILKVSLTGDGFNPVLYDWHNGHGAARKALERARLLPQRSTTGS